MKRKIKLFDKTWKKCLWIFIIIFSIATVGLVVSVNYLSENIEDHNIHKDTIIVTDKKRNDSLYIVIDEDNNTYGIHDDNYGKTMFDSIKVGEENIVVIEDPKDSGHPLTHILQVNNGTSYSQ